MARPALDRSLYFEVLPATAGGWPAVTGALVRLLERCSADGLWWATVDLGDDGRTDAFAHLGPDDGGAVWTEVSSDSHLRESDWLTPDQQAALVARGWKLPLDENGMENFHRSYRHRGINRGPSAAFAVLLPLAPRPRRRHGPHPDPEAHRPCCRLRRGRPRLVAPAQRHHDSPAGQRLAFSSDPDWTIGLGCSATEGR